MEPASINTFQHAYELASMGHAEEVQLELRQIRARGIEVRRPTVANLNRRLHDWYYQVVRAGYTQAKKPIEVI